NLANVRRVLVGRATPASRVLRSRLSFLERHSSLLHTTLAYCRCNNTCTRCLSQLLPRIGCKDAYPRSQKGAPAHHPRGGGGPRACRGCPAGARSAAIAALAATPVTMGSPCTVPPSATSALQSEGPRPPPMTRAGDSDPLAAGIRGWTQRFSAGAL